LNIVCTLTDIIDILSIFFSNPEFGTPVILLQWYLTSSRCNLFIVNLKLNAYHDYVSVSYDWTITGLVCLGWFGWSFSFAGVAPAVQHSVWFFWYKLDSLCVTRFIFVFQWKNTVRPWYFGFISPKRLFNIFETKSVKTLNVVWLEDFTKLNTLSLNEFDFN